MKLVKNLMPSLMNWGLFNMVEGVDYEFVIPDYDPEIVHIRILTGTFSGVVFNFGKVTFDEVDSKMYLQFTHDVVEYDKFDDLDTLEFKDYIGNILIQMISNNMNQEIVDESRTSNTEEFNT